MNTNCSYFTYLQSTESGITVKRTDMNQQFSTGYIGEPESVSTVISLKLYGTNSEFVLPVVSKDKIEYLFPDVSREWDYSKNKVHSSDVTPFSNRKVWWKCCHETEFCEAINERSKGKSGCDICSRKKWIASKRNNVKNSGKDITITHPEIIKDWDYGKNKFLPNEYTHGATENIYWLCSKCGLSWESPISRRTGYYKSGCPNCASSKGESKIRDFLKKNGIIYTKEKTFSDCKWKINGSLRFDFFIKKTI